MPRYIKPRKGYIRVGDRYAAVMTVDGRRKQIGTFATAEEAHTAYLTAREGVFQKSPRQIALENGDAHYTPDKPCKRGHLSPRNTQSRGCVECNRLWAALNVDHEKAKENARKYRKGWSDEKRKITRATSAKKSREWRKNNPGHHNALTKMHKKGVKERTPKWCDKDLMVEIYKGCPEGHHVDHIIPLRGENVSGLHIPENLQYLPARENIMKNNKFISDWG